MNACPLLNHHLHGDGERTVILLHGLFGLSANLGPLGRVYVGGNTYSSHSMGGKVAMQLALLAEDRVDTLVVADIAPVRYQPHHDGVFAGLLEAGSDPHADRRMTQRILQSHIRDPAVIAFLLMNRRRREDGTWFWRFNLDALAANYEAILRAPEMGKPFGGSTLFLKGELSDYVSGAHREETRHMFPAARLKVMAGTGHWLHAEKPTVFLRLVRDALRRP